MALLSLHAGLRLGEIYRLVWVDIDAAHGFITLMDTKSGRTRTVHMTGAVRAMFESIIRQDGQPLVFPGRGGAMRKGDIGNTFDKVVDELGFNVGVTDRRQRFTFHSLRYSHASWLAMSGTDLFTIQKILGHSSIAMTERYSHLAPAHLKAASESFEAAIELSREGCSALVVGGENGR